MKQRFLNFVRGLATNRIGALGVALTTTAFVLFLAVELLRVLGVVTSAYVGLVTYLALALGMFMGPVQAASNPGVEQKARPCAVDSGRGVDGARFSSRPKTLGAISDGGTVDGL